MNSALNAARLFTPALRRASTPLSPAPRGITSVSTIPCPPPPVPQGPFPVSRPSMPGSIPHAIRNHQAALSGVPLTFRPS
ncbi:hypothetical protein FRC12_001095 [Ceratobasidium sp. 428]|nr:hypothetical protein FRC12_001095 [Ceratobasidium sp. 428]